MAGSLRDSAALIWMANGTISRIKTYGKATDKYNMDLRYGVEVGKVGRNTSYYPEGIVANFKHQKPNLGPIVGPAGV